MVRKSIFFDHCLNLGSQLLATGLEKLEKVSNQAYDALNEQPYDEEGKSKMRVKDAAKGVSLMSVLQEAKSRYEVQEKVYSNS